MSDDRQPTKIDRHVGKRLRARRQDQDVSQELLAEKLGVTFQQVQKYESGKNRMSAARLWDASRALAVPVGHFFEGLAP